ncbi:MAG: lasso peptide biosynthesis B2 protein [Nitrospinota bacterium]|nr:lasso peptide biosynthesis B2 protein [Nitrospinota bacterium]
MTTDDGGLTLREKIIIIREALAAIMVAARFRAFDRNGAPPMPEIALKAVVDRPTAERIAKLVGFITRLVVVWKRRICFYRSFATACVLRTRGVPVALNFGYRWDGPTGSMAHCWMTLEGELFRETEETGRIYTAYLGEKEAAIRFWADPDNDPVNREKLIKREIDQ